jgi:hypothetical protein
LVVTDWTSESHHLALSDDCGQRCKHVVLRYTAN